MVQSNLIAHVALRMERSLILEFVKHLLYLPLDYYEKHSSGEVVSRQQDIQEINRVVFQVMVGIPSHFCITLISLILMIFYSKQLTIMAIVFTVLMILLPFIFLKRIKSGKPLL